ncbi:MAG: polyprenol monophosphomannose synthase [Tepidisphaeraceae bacterium]
MSTDSSDRPDVSIVVPALNEAENLPALARRVARAMAGRRYELIIVDDASRDATPQVCAELAKSHPLSLLVRDDPKDGLSGAVLHGFARAAGDTLVVMDADLQHPPERLPALLEPLETGDADFVIGSRYAPGGSTREQWGIFRKINSRVATMLARPFAVPRVTDPMSGFFALRRSTFDAARRLTPLGYKIGLELMCKCRVRNVREVPIDFVTREHGRSKLTLKQQFKYLEHLSRLYDYTFPRAAPVIKFLIALACGWGVALGVYGAIVRAGARDVWAPVLAYPAAILVTAVFHLRYVRTQREFIVRPHPWRDFWVISLAEWATCALAAMWLTSRVDPITWWELFVLSFGAATVTRYVLRKEFLQDIRGLRKELRRDEIV